MDSLRIGYARCSTSKQDTELQRKALADLGIDPERVYIDEGLTGTNRDRPGLDQALAACRAGDVFTVTKLDRAFRSVPDANTVIQGLADRGVKFGLGGSIYDWNDPFGRMFLQMLAVFAEFEANLIKLRTREGMARAKAKGKLKGGKPKLNPKQSAHLVELHDAGEHSISELAELFNVARPTVYRTIARSA
jgi:DNA invertase Pin-like site-specific DNA recombinase